MGDGSGDQRDDGDGDAWWDRLGGDMTALILSKLPLRSMLRASAVCTAWRAAALRATASPRHGRPWLFFHGRSNGSGTGSRNAFAFDPDEPSSWVTFTIPPDFIAGAGGYAFVAPSPSRLAFAPLLRDGVAWRHAPPLASSRNNNPVVAAVGAPGSGDGGERLLLLVAGGGGFPGGLVNIGDRLPTQLYEWDPHCAAAGGAGAWELCAPLPDDLAGAASSSSSSLSISSALVGSRFLFACDVHSCAVSAFDLSRRAWAPPRKLCPRPPVPGLAAAFVATARRGKRLVVAGVVEEEGRPRAVGVWDVEPDTLAARRIGEMPAEMAPAVLPPHDGIGGVRCVGQDGVIYVVSEEEHGGYPACACEVIGGGDDGEEEELACRWSMLPPLPTAASGRSGFRRMAAFCSPVLFRNHLHAD
ncbi:unnamed protein product [Urochloa humidicola]